jgi:hypothetical protein
MGNAATDSGGHIELSGDTVRVNGLVQAIGLSGTGGITITHGGNGVVPFVVGDAAVNVVTATTTVTITNLAPITDTGADQTVKVNEPVTLDGSGSFDPDGHLPLILNNFVAAPDLVVHELTVDESGVTVIIGNVGNTAVTNPFWVDVYFDPKSPTPFRPLCWRTVSA